MSDNNSLKRIVEEIEYLCAKRMQGMEKHPRFVVVHGHHQPGTLCLQGETVERAYLVFQAREIPLRLSPTGLVIADCLARHRRNLMSAAQIERIFLSDSFYLRLGANALRGARTPIKPRRATVKVYIQRLRAQLAEALKEAGLNVPGDQMLLSETTDSNVVVYRLASQIQIEIVHQDALLLRRR